MPYTLKLYLYVCVAGLIAFVLAVWLSRFGWIVNIVLAFVGAYLTIIIGRRVLGRHFVGL